MDPIFVVAAERTLGELKVQSQLADSWLGMGLPPEQLAGSGNPPSHSSPIHLIDPAKITNTDFPRLLSLQESVVAHLLVVTAEETLEKFIDEANDFAQLLCDQMVERDLTVQHILVLIDAGGVIEQTQLDRLLGMRHPSGRGDLWSGVYAMTWQLEPIGDLAFTAAEAWPTAVGHLLMHWIHARPPRNQVGTAKNVCLAWRHLMFTPKTAENVEGFSEASGSAKIADGQDRMREQMKQSLARVWDQVFTDRTCDRYDLTWEPLGSTLTAQKIKPDPMPKAPSDWLHYPSLTRIERAIAFSRWIKTTRQAGKDCRLHWARQCAERMHQVQRLQSKYWKMVHVNPSVLLWPLTKDQADQVGQTAPLTSGFQRLAELQRSLQQQTAEQEECAAEFEVAKRGWVEWPWRLATTFAVILAVGYAVMLTVWFLMGNVYATGGCFVATVIGAGLGAWMAESLESKAGQRGKYALEDNLESLSVSISDGHTRSIDILEETFQSREADLKILLRKHLETKRLRIVRWLAGINAVIMADLFASPDSDASRSECRFRTSTTLPISIRMNAISRSGWLDQFIAAEVEHLQQLIWTPSCQWLDRSARGAIDQERLEEELKKRFVTFQARFLTAASRATLNEQSRTQLNDWYAILCGMLQVDRYLSGASCHFPSGAAPPNENRPAVELVFQAGFEQLGRDSRLQEFRYLERIGGSKRLEDIPAVGYLHERIPVRLTILKGRLAVEHWEGATASSTGRVPNEASQPSQDVPVRDDERDRSGT